jgi:hypothetical protein
MCAAAAFDVDDGFRAGQPHIWISGLKHMSEHIGVHVYYGSRAAQPRRVRAFIDLAIQRLMDSPTHILSAKELSSAAASWRRDKGRH